MNYEEYDKMSDNPLNRSICANCKMSALDIEQHPHIECSCDWFQTRKYGEEDEEPNDEW